MFLRRKTTIFYVFRHIVKTMETSATEQVTLKKIIEGPAEIHLVSDGVFYNPVQEFNRDLSIAVLNVFLDEYIAEKTELFKKRNKNKNEGEDSQPQIEVNLLEALAATGLRSIRYAKEVPKLNKVVANDLSKTAVETMKVNFEKNLVADKVEPSLDDACMLMYKHKHPSSRFAAIDLDPYGCPSPFLDAAVQSVQDGGLLLVTATDMAVLAGNSPETCYSKYGAISLKTKCCHEMALRILLQCIESHANRYSRYIEPLLSISADFYIRVFVKVHTGALQCKQTTSKLGMVYHCKGCDNMTLQPLGDFKPNPTEKRPDQQKAVLPPAPTVGAHCENCNQRHSLGGPVWAAPIHSERFVTDVLTRVETDDTLALRTSNRILGVLSMVREELHDAPFYHALDKMCGRVHVTCMPALLMRSAILNAGYKVSYSHASKLSVKSPAPARLLWDIIRAWAKEHPVNPKRVEADPIAKHILSHEITHTIDFSERPDANPCSRRDGRLRFQFNPEPHWGPGSRAVVNTGDNRMEKAKRNQNKYTKDKVAKRQHSESDEETRKKCNVDNENNV
ncbi:tRNA (guanine(26)-N(2))-dimethyltransferase [Ostrinia nubilalis]|uniref:tRNA (guanine(26)-N(2))-dimethyltransferase n=1 Tax=Ostrinia nubilalis TaxID=29057 RepID=UPI003082293F